VSLLTLSLPSVIPFHARELRIEYPPQRRPGKVAIDREQDYATIWESLKDVQHLTRTICHPTMLILGVRIERSNAKGKKAAEAGKHQATGVEGKLHGGACPIRRTTEDVERK